jgi:hypothetical protein
MSISRDRRAALRTTGGLLAILQLALLVGACSDSNPITPTPPPSGPTVVSISPATGSTAGGTDITIIGTSFSGTPTVTLGGVAATGVRVLGTTTIQAVTGAHAAGAVDIVVTVGTSAATRASGFTYVAPAGPTVSAISPNSGTTAGGTSVTISGANFAAASAVTFGGVAAASVTFVNETTLRAVTPAHVAGAVDVRVTTGSLFGTLSGGFTYIVVTNTLPVISTITVKGGRLNEPANFADLGEEVNVIASVTDAETTLDKLSYAWTATAGTINGTGRAVTWRAPAAATLPLQVTLTLRVTETLDGTLTQSVTASTTANVHDSRKESGDLAVRFLTEFSSARTTPPSTIVRDFWTADVCKAGRDAELQDVADSQANYQMLSYKIGEVSSWTLSFGGTCPLNEPGDGCVAVPCEWKDMRLKDGEIATSTGTCLLSAAYRQSRWWLCSSRYQNLSGGHTFLPGVPFIR